LLQFYCPDFIAPLSYAYFPKIDLTPSPLPWRLRSITAYNIHRLKTGRI
jgi:hypothetical protein